MHRRIGFKRYSVLIVTGLLALFSAGCASIKPTGSATQDASVAQLTPLKVCYSSVTATQSVMLYAYEKGIFQRYGLDVELLYIEGGSTATAALIADQVDICQVAGSPVINSVVAGSDLTLIAGLYNSYLFSLVVRPEIGTAADLKGKAVAISEPGSSSDAAMRAMLRSLGVQPDQDITLLATGGQSARLAAMANGAVVGTVVSVTETAQARATGYRELVDMESLQNPFPHTALATSRHFIANHRETVIRFLQATLAAIAEMKHDRVGVTEVLAQYLSLDPQIDAVTLDATYTTLIEGYLPSVPYPTLDGIQAQLDSLVATNPAAANVKSEAAVDTTLLAEIEASGFIQQLEEK